MKVVFMGSGDISVPTLQWLVSDPGIEMVGVVTQPDRPAGRGLQVVPSAVKQLAVSRGIPTMQPARVRAPEVVEQIAALQPDVLVVMAYGQILPQQLLDVPRLGALNLHASLLPRHRGAAPVHAAILAGDSKSGVTVMWMDAGLDTGDILLVKECTIDPAETAGTLHDKIAALAPLGLAEALPLLGEGRAPRLKQEDSLATYAPKLDRSLGRLDWTRSAGETDRVIRGLYPWPGCTATIELEGGRRMDLKIHRAEISDQPANPAELRFACAGGGVISLLEVQAPGGRRMSAGDFARGNKVVRGGAES
jgi:methionyl-tRNA formyltransferase